MGCQSDYVGFLRSNSKGETTKAKQQSWTKTQNQKPRQSLKWLQLLLWSMLTTMNIEMFLWDLLPSVCIWNWEHLTNTRKSVMDMCCVCKERIAGTNSENSNHFFLQVCSPLMAFSLCVSSLVMSALQGLVAQPELSSAFVNSNHTSSWPCCYRFPSKMSLRESAFCAHQCALLYSHRYQQKPRFNEVCVNSTPIITL